MAKQRASRSDARSKREARLRERYQCLETYDRQLCGEGLELVAGVDEAGRGALAGPVVAAAVVLPPGSELVGVDDSKQIDERTREEIFGRIVAAASSLAIAFAQPRAIDRDNILQATLASMHRAVDALRVTPDLVLIDGRESIHWPGRVVTVKKGDATSLCIAAASIVAKVARDRAMRRLHRRYPQYNFESNKGYGTPDHIEALLSHGAADVHRQTFVANFVAKNMTMF